MPGLRIFVEPGQGSGVYGNTYLLHNVQCQPGIDWNVADRLMMVLEMGSAPYQIFNDQSDSLI